MRACACLILVSSSTAVAHVFDTAAPLPHLIFSHANAMLRCAGRRLHERRCVASWARRYGELVCGIIDGMTAVLWCMLRVIAVVCAFEDVEKRNKSLYTDFAACSRWRTAVAWRLTGIRVSSPVRPRS